MPTDDKDEVLLQAAWRRAAGVRHRAGVAAYPLALRRCRAHIADAQERGPRGNWVRVLHFGAMT